MSTEYSPAEISNSHRWHAVECNNRAWDLASQAVRSAAENEEMLNAAHASAFHWSKAGNELNHFRAKMLLAHVHARAGNGRLALDYAQQMIAYFTSKETPDWELAFAHAILTHAASTAGERGLFERHHAEASRLGNLIADAEERSYFFKSFDGIPRP